jgi:hypothetical protein
MTKRALAIALFGLLSREDSIDAFYATEGRILSGPFLVFAKLGQSSFADLNIPKRHISSFQATCFALEFQMAEQLA